MPAWSGSKVNPTELNSGNEFTENDQVAIEELNAMVNGGLYAQDFAEALADTPDNSDANNVGTASVELVDNVKGGKTYKKFKFSNLKGIQGIQGEQGIQGIQGEQGIQGDTGTSYRAMGAWDSSTPYINNSSVIDTVQFSGSTYYAKTSNTGQSPTDGTDNAYWGVLALKGSDVDIVQTTGTSTTAVMSQNAVTAQLNLKASNTDLANSFNSVDYLKDPDKTYLVIKIPEDSKGFTLVTGTTGSPDYTIEWGDSASDNITDTANPSHQYATAGMYLITISDDFANGIEYGPGANVNKDKIIEVYGGSKYPTSIGTSAFNSCSNLTTASFPNVTSIGSLAFSGCISLTTENFPQATSIDNYAFANCRALKTVNFPNVTTIGTNAFYRCTSLKELTLGNVTTTGTGSGRFQNVKLVNLTIAQDVDTTDIDRIKQLYADNGGTFIGAQINSI